MYFRFLTPRVLRCTMRKQQAEQPAKHELNNKSEINLYYNERFRYFSSGCSAFYKAFGIILCRKYLTEWRCQDVRVPEICIVRVSVIIKFTGQFAELNSKKSS
jgi:hypothetical protein